MKPVFCRFQQFPCTYESLRYLDVVIWRFLWRWQMTDRQQTNKTDCFTPYACPQGNNILNQCSSYPHNYVQFTSIHSSRHTPTLHTTTVAGCWKIIEELHEDKYSSIRVYGGKFQGNEPWIVVAVAISTPYNSILSWNLDTIVSIVLIARQTTKVFLHKV